MAYRLYVASFVLEEWGNYLNLAQNLYVCLPSPQFFAKAWIAYARCPEAIALFYVFIINFIKGDVPSDRCHQWMFSPVQWRLGSEIHHCRVIVNERPIPLKFDKTWYFCHLGIGGISQVEGQILPFSSYPNLFEHKTVLGPNKCSRDAQNDCGETFFGEV